MHQQQTSNRPTNQICNQQNRPTNQSANRLPGGGDYEPVFNWIRDNGGVALEQDYPYRSANDFCK
jgi:hypothetical protein